MSTKKLKIHFIGIGGIGVSALAQYYLAKGHQVSGSDLVSSEITDALRKKGVKIFIGKENTKNLSKKFDLIIHSPAVNVRHSMSNILSYPEALGELTKQYFTIAVAGTHGKSTTTAMVALILIKAGLDPTVIIGTKLKEFGDSNFRMGGTKNYKLKTNNYLVIEADEHMASFLNYWPKIIVVTNIEKDHLDYYKNYKNILKAFKEFISHLPKDGYLIKPTKNPKEAKKLRKILKVPGEHNISNALAALAVARILKIPDRISFKALSEYKGAWRRFEERTIKLKTKNYKVISDYGHHPTKVRVTLKAAREKYPKKKIWCVFQPHQYQRTYYLFNDFVKVFRQALVDKLIITDIFDVAGRERQEIKKKISSEKLIKAIAKSWAIYLPKNKIIDYLKKNLQGNEVVIFMGAGDIYEVDKTFK